MRQLAIWSGVFLLTVYLPLATVIYWSGPGKLYCSVNERCYKNDYALHINALEELAGYFRHQRLLTLSWSKKEQLHLQEVRQIYDSLFFVVLASIVLLAIGFRRQQVAKAGLISLMVLSSLLVIVPFFGLFWDGVLHPILFDNLLWKNYSSDISYYITPKSYFRYVFIFLIIVAGGLNAGVWWMLRSK